jgi:hypothetical protein
MQFNFRQFFTRTVILGALGICAALLTLTFLWIVWTAPPAPAPGMSLAVLTIIPAPTSTPPNLPTVTPDPNAPTATPAPGQISLGSYVQITGTAGEGLRIRSAPGLASSQLFLGYDSEVFLVKDGPRQVDGYTWYYLVASYDEKRAGWAASDFLGLMPNP